MWTEIVTWSGAALIAADWLLRLVLAVRVIMRDATVAVSLSWLLLLVLVPIPFVPSAVYLLVGEPRLGLRRAEQHSRLSSRIENEAVVHWRRQGLDWTSEDPGYRPLARLATSMGGMPALRGNDVELLGTGGPVLDRLIADIEESRHHCHLLFYIWMPANKGLEVCEALMRAAGRGVECRVLVDAVGSKQFLRHEIVERMRRAGVKVVDALPVNPFRMLLARIDLRNHRKLAVIDGRIAYCGSQNLTDETFRLKRRAKVGPWIDSTVRLRGPAVQALQTVFLRDWVIEADEELADLAPYFPRESEEPAGQCVVHVLATGPGGQPDAIHSAMLAMLFGAQHEIIMTTPYFVPDEATKAALINAAWRGVDVTLVIPDVLDARLVAAAARSHFGDLLGAGVRIVQHPHGLLHAKTATIDRRLAVVGSANFDMRSFWLNFECTLFVYDEGFARQLRFMQKHFEAEGRPVSAARWKRRPLHLRFVDQCAQLFSPLL
ncbi:MAG: cardiolipin synthase [Leptolyngbya sp. PLA1]|nr:cardiolipin synthase [Leptolyngbya sp. PLA1]